MEKIKKVSENRKIREKALLELTDKFKKSSSIIVWDYLGLKANEMADLRKNIKNAGGDNKVYKNSIASLAFKNVDKNEIQSVLVGGSSFLITFNENNNSLKVLHDVISKNKKLKFKGGYIDGVFYDAKSILEIAGLPEKDVMLSMLLSVLQANMRNLAYSLQQIADKKQEQ